MYLSNEPQSNTIDLLTTLYVLIKNITDAMHMREMINRNLDWIHRMGIVGIFTPQSIL